VEFKNKEELVNEAIKRGACEDALEWVSEQPDLKAILQNCPLGWRIWCMVEGFTQFDEYLDFNRLDGLEWAALLRSRPEFAEHCDFDRLEGNHWVFLLRLRSEFAEYCDWSKLDGYAWARLLIEKPEFGRYCDWSKLSKHNWAFLLIEQPQFAKHCPKRYREYLVAYHSEFGKIFEEI